MINLDTCRKAILLLVFLALSGPISAAHHEDSYGPQLGTVEMSVSCNNGATKLFQRGLALLHHMTYDGAQKAFSAASVADPDCAMSYWGQAMTVVHPLWSDPPSQEEFKAAKSWLDKAKKVSQKSALENSFIKALDYYFAEGQKASEKANLRRLAEGWGKVYKQFPNEPEALSFHALTQLAISNPSDKSYTIQKQAGALAEKVLGLSPNHPGGHHYVIHAYDYPALANQALEVARSYGKIAPDVPHALHMPSHIFTRLGLWPESIDMNRRSARAALKHSSGGVISLHYLHALDYLTYAHLQRGEYEDARKTMKKLNDLSLPAQTHVASAYTYAAVPARYALEQHHWGEAADLKERWPDTLNWNKFPAMEAITHFAKALGSANMGDRKAAEKAIDKLATLEKKTDKSSAYWAKQVKIQRLSALAWLQFNQGEQKKALKTMLQAAELEASTEKHPVTPGEILPAQELLADMYFALEDYQQAQIAYETTLMRSPNRFNSLYGAARSAQIQDDREGAKKHFRQLLTVTSQSADGQELDQARAYLGDDR